MARILPVHFNINIGRFQIRISDYQSKKELFVKKRLRCEKMAENDQSSLQKPSSITELQNFKNVNNSLMQDALNVWAELWAELDGHVGPGEKSLLEAAEGFKPSCGWSQYLEKMWVLWYYLDFAKRISQQ